MKTVNLTIDDQTWHTARALAAERDTSVSSLVREAFGHLSKTMSAGIKPAKKS
jgi:hypothetical protein